MKTFWMAAAAAVTAILIGACSDDSGTGPGPTPADTVRAIAFTTGTWWVEVSHDTTKQVTRSSSTTEVTTVQSIEEHHTYYRVLATWTGGDTTYYAILESDTLVTGAGGIATDTLLLYQIGAKVRIVPGNMGYLSYIDTLRFTSYELPMTVGSSWTVLDAALDTAIRFDLGAWDASLSGQQAKVRVQATGSGTATVPRMVTHVLGGRTPDCFEIETDVGMPYTVTLDTALSLNVGLPLPLTIPSGTRLVTGRVNYEASERFSMQYTVPFTTREMAASYDSTNVLGLFWEVGNDTTWSSTAVVVYYDAVSGQTIGGQ